MVKKEVLARELESVKTVERDILKRLDKDEAVEKEILKQLEKPSSVKQVKRFTFSDFGQVVVGALVFGLPVMFVPAFWGVIDGVDSIPAQLIPTFKLVLIHIMIVVCVVITLNYAYRKSFAYNREFITELFKRLTYTYLTVSVLMLIMLWTFNKLHASMLTLDLVRYMLASNSVGLVGAVTFDFLMD